MSKFKEFPKGDLKRTNHFHDWVALGVVFLGIGIAILVTGKFPREESSDLEGNAAYLIGAGFILVALIDLFYLFFRAKKYEEKRTDFHVLENFEDVIEGYKTVFEVDDVFISQGDSGLHAFYYRLQIYFKKNLQAGLYIKQRDKIDYFFWKIGIAKIFDLLTGNPYFDSKYKLKCKEQNLFKKILTQDVIYHLEEFDKDYPPIRSKNGVLVINDKSINYIEGPYREDHRLFDPHRGKLQDTFEELIKIVKEIEKNIWIETSLC